MIGYLTILVCLGLGGFPTTRIYSIRIRTVPEKPGWLVTPDVGKGLRESTGKGRHCKSKPSLCRPLSHVYYSKAFIKLFLSEASPVHPYDLISYHAAFAHSDPATLIFLLLKHSKLSPCWGCSLYLKTLFL